MIASFADKDTERIWHREFARRLPKPFQMIVYRKLVMIHRALDLNDLRILPGNRLETLRAERRGQHSIRINDQWRICFQWNNGQAMNVEVTDYH